MDRPDFLPKLEQKFVQNFVLIYSYKFVYSLSPKIDAFSKNSRKFQNSKNFWRASSKSRIFDQNHFRSNSDTLLIPHSPDFDRKLRFRYLISQKILFKMSPKFKNVNFLTKKIRENAVQRLTRQRLTHFSSFEHY